MSLFVWQVAVLEYSYFMTMNKSSFCIKMRNLSQKAPPQLKYKYKYIYIYTDVRERERDGDHSMANRHCPPACPYTESYQRQKEQSNDLWRSAEFKIQLLTMPFLTQMLMQLMQSSTPQKKPWKLLSSQHW